MLLEDIINLYSNCSTKEFLIKHLKLVFELDVMGNKAYSFLKKDSGFMDIDSIFESIGEKLAPYLSIIHFDIDGCLSNNLEENNTFLDHLINGFSRIPCFKDDKDIYSYFENDFKQAMFRATLAKEYGSNDFIMLILCFIGGVFDIFKSNVVVSDFVSRNNLRQPRTREEGSIVSFLAFLESGVVGMENYDAILKVVRQNYNNL